MSISTLGMGFQQPPGLGTSGANYSDILRVAGATGLWLFRGVDDWWQVVHPDLTAYCILNPYDDGRTQQDFSWLSLQSLFGWTPT